MLPWHVRKRSRILTEYSYTQYWLLQVQCLYFRYRFFAWFVVTINLRSHSLMPLNIFISCSFAKSWCGMQYLNNQIDSCVIEAILIFDSHTYTKEKSNFVFRSEEFYKLKQIWSVSFNKFLTFFFTILSLFWLQSFHSYILLVGGWGRRCTTPLALEIHFLLTWKLVQRFTHTKKLK